MKGVIFRAWAGPTERGDTTPASAAFGVSLSRNTSAADVRGTTYSFNTPSESGSAPTRPTMSHYPSSFSRSTAGNPKMGKPTKKRKHRLVNLRKKTAEPIDDMGSVSGGSITSSTPSMDASSSIPLSTSDSGSALVPQTLPSLHREDEMITPPDSPPRGRHSPRTRDLGKTPQRLQATIRPAKGRPQRPKPSRYFQSFQFPSRGPSTPGEQSTSPSMPSAGENGSLPAPFPYLESSAGGILEQAWMMRMANEIAKRVQEQKCGETTPGRWDQVMREEPPPPAYAA